MTLLELAASLPNGLHDAEITELSLSFRERVIRITVDVWIGDMAAPRERLEEYRPALIELSDFEYCILDRPDATYPYKTNRELTIDVTAADPSVALAGEGSACRFWVGDWNSFIHIRAGEAVLTWTGPAVFRPPAAS